MKESSANSDDQKGKLRHVKISGLPSQEWLSNFDFFFQQIAQLLDAIANEKEDENKPDENLTNSALTLLKLGILRRVTMSFRGKRSMYLAGGRVQQMLFQRFKVSY